ncbi:MAG: hypothetical protein ABEN55_18260 [Bradymonadaceae bacterium]
MIRYLKTPWVLLLFVWPLANCQCSDQIEYGWDLGHEPDAVADIGPDTEPDVDVWEPENVLPEICKSDARNDRTSLVVDDNGTLWLGFHKYAGENCQNSTLVVYHKRLGGRWVREDIQPHEGIFGLSIIDSNRPIAVFPDPSDGTFKAAHRRGDREWTFHEFDLGNHRVTRRDGFDVTEDGDRFFVTFAEDDGTEVRLYTSDPSTGNSRWKSRRSLEVPDPRAAMERGLRADSDDSVYLVHNNRKRGRFGLARYDKQDNRWPERNYFSDRNSAAYVHSFVITDNFRLCLSSRYRGRLMVTCGTMFNLQMERKVFTDQRIAERFPSSLVEAPNGQLYVAFQPADNSELRVAKRSSDGKWSVQTVFDQPAFGVSTAIDTTGDLVMGFYTCEKRGLNRFDNCSLKVLRENPDEL